MKAKFIKNLEGFRGDARLYKVTPQVSYNDNKKTSFVVVSAVHAYGGPETFIFPSDKSGEVLDWGELEGSFKGGLNHTLALRNAGYELENQND